MLDSSLSKTLDARLPEPFPTYDTATDFYEWVEAHQDELDNLTDQVTQVLLSLQIAHAEGQSLDLIGREFGIIGRRRGRQDDVYRQFLISLIPSIRGRGTVPGVERAIGAGLLVGRDAVKLIEDFQDTSYQVELTDWTPHRTGIVREMAQLADPSSVDRNEPVFYILDTAVVTYAVGNTNVASTTTSEMVSPVYSVGDTQSTTVDSSGTFGTGRFDGEDTFS